MRSLGIFALQVGEVQLAFPELIVLIERRRRSAATDRNGSDLEVNPESG